MIKVAARRLASAIVAALVCASAPAFAQSPEAMAEFRRDCTFDYTRLCSAYDPDSAEVRQCFVARRAELSPRCAATIAKYEPKPQQKRR